MADDRFTVRVHVSAVDDVTVLNEALLAWLGEVDVERSSYASHAGPTMLTLSVELRRKADLRRAWSGLDEAALNTLLAEVGERLDEEGGLHFRVDLGPAGCGSRRACSAGRAPLGESSLQGRRVSGSNRRRAARSDDFSRPCLSMGFGHHSYPSSHSGRHASRCDLHVR